MPHNEDMGTNWSFLEGVDGANLENFIAACLRQEHSDALQTQPAQGDGGVDVYRETEHGQIVWQVKRFSTRLTPGQKQQIKNSWARFHSAYVAQGTPITAYNLVTPWTPTEQLREWFREEVVGDVGFPTQWDGESFVEGLAAKYPALYGHYFKGPDYFENLIATKAMLAQSPIEKASSTTMLEATLKRHEAVQDITDQISETYNVDRGVITTLDGSLPRPGANEAGVAYRYKSLGNNRFLVESVVPTTAQSTELDPISLEVTFQVAPESAEEKELLDWQHWGRPFKNLSAQCRTQGGPWHEDEKTRHLLTIEMDQDDDVRSPLAMTFSDLDDIEVARLRLEVVEVTHGIVGGGLRMLTRSPSEVISFETRLFSTVAPDENRFEIGARPGSSPEDVLAEISAVNTLTSGHTIVLTKADDGKLVARFGVDKVTSTFTRRIEQIAQDLTDLQAHTTDTLTMPDMAQVTENQLAEVRAIADIYRGNEHSGTWDKLELVVEDEEKARDFAKWHEPRDAYAIGQPTFTLGQEEFVVTRRFARRYESAALLEEMPPEGWTVGNQVTLAPSGSNKVVTVMLSNDKVDGTAGLESNND